MKTKEFILQTAKQIGIEKGYREDHPEDWYGGISNYELILKKIQYRDTIIFFESNNDIIKALFTNYIFIEWKFKQVRHKYWNDPDNAKKFLMYFHNEHKRPPTKKECIDLGVTAAIDNNGGLLNLCQQLNIWDIGKEKKKRKTKSYILEIARKIGIQKGYKEDCPEDWYCGITCKEFNKNNIGTGAIQKKFNGVNDVIRCLFPLYNFIEHKFKKVQNNYWDNFENLRTILLDFYKIKGRAPNIEECESMGIISGCNKHGGIIKLSILLNMPFPHRFKTLSKDIVRSTYEVIFSNFCYLNNINLKYEGKIVDHKNYRYDFKITDEENTFIEIWGLSIKKQTKVSNIYKNSRHIKTNLYKKNNLKLIEIEGELFLKNINSINAFLINIMKINNIKYDNFYDGDLILLTKFDSLDKEEAINELKKMVIDNKMVKMPTYKWFMKNYHYGKYLTFLKTSCGMHFREIANVINVKLSFREPYYWLCFNNVIHELLPICEKINKFPDKRYLREIKRIDIITAIDKHYNGFGDNSMLQFKDGELIVY